MTQAFPSLNWQAQEDATIPIAAYTVDFSVDQTWQWKTSDGHYLQRRINPTGVMVDNTNNAFQVNVTYGALTVPIPGLGRLPISFPAGVDVVSITAPSQPASGQVPVTFYVKEPAPGATGTAPQSTAATMNPNTEGANFSQATTQLATGVTALQLPAGNKNGLIIRRASIGARCAANENPVMGLFVGTAAPVDAASLAVPAILYLRSSLAAASNGATPIVDRLQNPMKFPAATGIWVALLNIANTVWYNVSWDLL